MRWLFLATLVACWRGSPAPPVTRTVETRPNPTSCPATFATATGSCQGSASCNFAEGSCYCGEPPICSGVDRSDEPPQPTVWVCRPVPPKVRPDGCPGVANAGEACEQANQRCSYGDCCVSVLTCTGGTWQETAQECPP